MFPSISVRKEGDFVVRGFVVRGHCVAAFSPATISLNDGGAEGFSSKQLNILIATEGIHCRFHFCITKAFQRCLLYDFSIILSMPTCNCTYHIIINHNVLVRVIITHHNRGQCISGGQTVPNESSRLYSQGIQRVPRINVILIYK